MANLRTLRRNTMEEYLLERTINRNEVAEIERIYTEPVTCMCKNLLKGSIISPGIDFIPLLATKVPTDEMQSVIDTVWVPFMANVLDDIFKYGFAPYKVISKKIEGKTVRVPVSVPIYLFNVVYVIDHDYNRSLLFYNRNSSPGAGYRPDKSIKVLVDTYPTEEGRLTSRCSTVLKRHMVNKDMINFRLQMEYNRSSPVVYTQTQPTGNDSNNFEVDTLAQSDLLDLKDQVKFVKEKNQMNHINAMKSMNETLNKKRKHSLMNADGTQQYEYIEPYNNMYQLPDNVVMATQPALTNPNNDVLRFIDLFNVEVCLAFNVPKRIILSEGGGGLDRSHQIEINMLSRTIDTIQNVLQDFLHIVYKDVYGELDIEARFRTMKIVDAENIKMLLDMGIVLVDSVAPQLVRAAGLDDSTIDTTEYRRLRETNATTESLATKQKSHEVDKSKRVTNNEHST